MFVSTGKSPRDNKIVGPEAQNVLLLKDIQESSDKGTGASSGV